MADTAQNERLNGLLIRLYRSLLQYVAESSVWTDVHTEANARAIQQMAADQRSGASRLAELLNRRGCFVDMGVYPTTFTDLHFLALEFLYKQLEADESQAIVLLEQARAAAADDAEAASLFGELAAAEQTRLARLREMAAQRTIAA